ncbi:MAG: hypothetical protein JWQ07_6021, partial [Ramlibacter sp.]|nr:hypothetical protein [Ramlibacter sp.]
MGVMVAMAVAAGLEAVEAAASKAAALPFTAAASGVAPSIAAAFAPGMSSAAVALATVMQRPESAGIISRRDAPTGIIATISVRAIMVMRRPIIMDRAVTAGRSGPITARARSAAIARGITTGAITIAGITAS